MCRIPPGKRTEYLELSFCFLGYCVLVSRRYNLVQRSPVAVAIFPLSEIEMETHAQPKSSLASAYRILRAPGLHHQTSAGDDSSVMGREDRAIHAIAQSEVIGVHD